MIKRLLQLLFGLMVVAVGYGYFLEYRSPGQWSLVWQNFQTTKALSALTTDTLKVFKGDAVHPATMSAEDLEQLVYRWTDNNGGVNISFQPPQGVADYEVIRLGDLNYNVQKSLSKDQMESQ